MSTDTKAASRRAYEDRWYADHGIPRGTYRTRVRLGWFEPGGTATAEDTERFLRSWRLILEVA